MRFAAILVAAALPVAACDTSEMTGPAASAVCRQIGAQCRLADGPLGVCIEKPCEGDATPPCFACTPQH